MEKKAKKKALIFLIIVFCVAVYAAVRYYSVDRTAVREGGYYIIGGERYVEIPINFTKEGKTVAKGDSFKINEIPEDKSHTFLTVRSFLDNRNIVKESYVIPTAGKLSVAYCGHERITGGKKRSMLQSIFDEAYQGSFVIKTNDRFDISNGTKNIYVGYEDCPVGTDWIGCLGNINDRLVFIKEEDVRDEDLRYTCYILKDEYQGLYENGVHNTFKRVD